MELLCMVTLVPTTYCDAERLCAENEYVTSSYTCAACPEHSTNPAGDNPGVRRYVVQVQEKLPRVRQRVRAVRRWI